jgi:hypothetical protein
MSARRHVVSTIGETNQKWAAEGKPIKLGLTPPHFKTLGYKVTDGSTLHLLLKK